MFAVGYLSSSAKSAWGKVSSRVSGTLCSVLI